MKNSILTLLLFHLVLFGFSQDMGYEVHGVYQRPILKEKLINAKTMSDINPGFPTSWISRYFSVAVLATCNGISRKAVSINDTLSNEQISILAMADLGTDVVVDVRYSPESSPKDDQDIRELNFFYTIVPETEAEYYGGYQVLKQYLKDNAIDKIGETMTIKARQATVRFTIDEQGQVINAEISRTSEDEKTDKLLLETINKMPKWKPAQNSNGTKVKQEFELSVGGGVGC